MAVDVELHAKRRPGGQAQESQSPLRIQEIEIIEIIMQTLARIRPQAPTLFLFAQPIGDSPWPREYRPGQAGRPAAPGVAGHDLPCVSSYAKTRSECLRRRRELRRDS